MTWAGMFATGNRESARGWKAGAGGMRTPPRALSVPLRGAARRYGADPMRYGWRPTGRCAGRRIWVGPRDDLAPGKGRGRFCVSPRGPGEADGDLAEPVSTRPRGTEDVLPDETPRWRRVERIARESAARAGFGEIRTPTFEHTELIHRIGDSTDVVQKETYDFSDRGGRSLTLRPEGTAPVVRACMQGGLLGGALPIKVFYVTLSAFRYERPQAGRLREHHQFGCECFGVAGPVADAELIVLMADFLAAAGIRSAVVRINSIGCDRCRPRYREALLEYYRERLPDLCADCRRRWGQNPLRLLDCKVDRPAALGAPRSVDHLCPECAEHFAGLRTLLDRAHLSYEPDPLLVRGFDYYTRTVFEFAHAGIGAQAALGGGGRYDSLVASLGGPQLPAAGFGLGMERLLAALELEGVGGEPRAGCDLFVAGEDAAGAFDLCVQARRSGLVAEFDPLGRSLKAQFRHADRLGARHVAVLGGPSRAVSLRDMRTHQQRDLAPEDILRALADAGGA